MKAKIYNTGKNVYIAAKERISYVFDNYEKIIVSFSGGKDSTALLYLSIEEAKKRNRKIYCFFLDQEMEYLSTFKIVDDVMKNEHIIPIWFQIHGILPTAINHKEYWLEPWNPDEQYRWIRPQKRVAIKKITWEHSVPYSFKNEEKFGFYGFIKVMEQMFGDETVAQLVGLRAEESLDRFRAVTKNPGIKDIDWCTKNNGNGIKFYPIYDWTFQDIWVYLSKNNLKYNKMYDYFWKKGYSFREMRVSSLLNRKAFQCISDLQEFEPKLYDLLLDRVSGIKTASEYSGKDKIFFTKKLPVKFKSWKYYRDFILSVYPNKDHANIFKERFSKQLDNEYVHRQQVFQLQIHDITNSKKIINKPDPNVALKAKWMSEL